METRSLTNFSQYSDCSPPPVNSQATPVNNLTEVSQRTLQPIPFVFTSRATLVNFRHTALPIQQRIVSTLTSLALLYVELCPHEM